MSDAKEDGGPMTKPGLIVVDNTWGLEHETYMKCRKALAEIKGESHE